MRQQHQRQNRHHGVHAVDRRSFLAGAGALAITGGVAPRLVFGDDAAAEPNRSKVGIARGSNMEDAVTAAVGLAGGVDFIEADQTVLIKPNVTGAAVYPTTTNPEVLYAVIKLVAARGPKRIIVADRSFSPIFDVRLPKTIDVMRRVGHVEAVEQAKLDFDAPVVAVGLEDAAAEFERLGLPADTPHWRRVKPEQATHWPDGFEMAELLYAVDHVINVPVIKTHFQAWFTMSMKAFVGMSHHRARKEFHGSFGGSNDLGDQKRTRRSRRKSFKQQVAEVRPLVNRIAELNLAITPALNILDGTKSFVYGGPSHGDTAEAKLIVASRDRVAADAVGVAVLKHLGTERRIQRNSVWTLPFIEYAVKIGLGVGSVDQVDLHAVGLDDEIANIREMLI